MNTLLHFVTLSEQSLGIIPVLALMLLVVFAVAIERAVFFWRTAPAARTLLDTLSSADLQQDPAVRQIAMRYRPTIFGATLAAIVDARHLCDADAMDRHVDEAIVRTLPELDRHLWLLDAAVTLGPLIGLLGTIIGITESFNVLGAAGPNVQAVTGGVGHALIATGCGLAVAIVGVAANSYFAKRVRICTLQLDLLKLMSVKRVHLTYRGAADGAGHDTHQPARAAIRRIVNGENLSGA